MLQTKVSESPIFEVIKQSVRKNEITDQRICRAPKEIEFIGQCYQTYLKSGARYSELLNKYTKHERTVKQTAEMLGFKLPKQ